MFDSIKNLKKWYFILIETGLILALLILLTAFKIDLGVDKSYEPARTDFDIPTLEEIPATDQKDTPPPPRKPRVFIEVPDDHIFDEPLDKIPDFSIDDAGNMPIEAGRSKNDEGDDVIFVPFEQRPKIIGGLASIYEKIKYPEKARLAGIEGTVIVQFIVNKNGEVTNSEVVRGIGGGCDEEALRVVKQITFEPARQRERYVRVKMSIPIKFQLQN